MQRSGNLLPTAPVAEVRREESYPTAALFFVWQPVIALFIGWAISAQRRSPDIKAGEERSELGAQATSPSLGVFLVILAGLVALSLTRVIPLRLRQNHREHIAATKKASKPSSVDLPIAQPMSEEQALVLNKIVDYQPGHVLERTEFVSHEKGFEWPTSLYFSTFYTRAGEPVPEWPQAPKQFISASVQQYPNSAWAQYFAEYPPRMYISPDDPRIHALVTQFNNKVRSNQLERSPGQTWDALYYMWPRAAALLLSNITLATKTLRCCERISKNIRVRFTDILTASCRSFLATGKALTGHHFAYSTVMGT